VVEVSSAGVSSASDPYRLGRRDIFKLPRLATVPEEVAHVVASFANDFGGTPAAPVITGQRVQVYVAGAGAAPFWEYVHQHEHCDVVVKCMRELKTKLAEVSNANDGQLSDDLLVLVGADEMQVPHIDLLKGQVQVIVALTRTEPTLVYDLQQELPVVSEVARYLGVDENELHADAGLAMLVGGGAPLVLPVAQVYRHMVHACSELGVGDAVQMRDGVVHAGPQCQHRSELPRMVLFATYTTCRTEQYDVGCQVKLWDWASHPAVPAMVAYKRLFEIHDYAQRNNLDIRPWLYCPPEQMEACKILCTTAGLEESRVCHIVEQWRGL